MDSKIKPLTNLSYETSRSDADSLLIEHLRRYGRQIGICNEAADVIERLRMFTTRGDRRAIGLSKIHLQHLRWSISKGLCSVERAAEVLGADVDGLRSALGLKQNLLRK